MQFQAFKRLDISNFDAKFRELIETLSVSINNSFDAIYDGLNGKLSVGDNFLTDLKDVQVTVDATGKPLTTTQFTLKKTITALKGLQVIRADNVTNTNVYPTGGIFITYTSNQNQTSQNPIVQILSVTGLPANNKFTLRIIAWG